MSGSYPPGVTGLEPEIVGLDPSEFPYRVWAMVDTLVYAKGPVVSWKPGKTVGVRYTVGLSTLRTER
jgi:hypothetical protein